METTLTPYKEIEFTRINNDTNGNPRYVCHFLAFITPEDDARIDAESQMPGYKFGRILYALDEKYKLAVKRANKLGGRKFHNKQYGGGVSFQSYNIKDLEKQINNLLASL